MKILVICQYYWPEPYPSSDVCEELVRRGHEVHVVTGVPNYPMGDIYPEYKRGKGRCQTHNGVKIIRTFTIGRRKNVFFRFLNYYSYAISSSFYVRQLEEDYDVVLVHQTSPIMMAYAAFEYAKRHGKKVILYCVDLWPTSLAAGGVRENSLMYKYYKVVSKRVYCRADKILVSSNMFRNYLETNFGIDAGRIVYHPQYAVGWKETAGNCSSKAEYGIDLMFAGNVGAAQSLMTIIEAADLLRDERQLRWHIVGEGSELNNLKAAAQKRGLENVIFHGRKALEEMPNYYAMADAMLVTLTKDPYISLTLPQKVQSYMAAGKPIIASADGEIPMVLKEAECGWCAKAEDAHELVEAVKRFIGYEEKAKLGENARAYYEKNFAKDRFMNELEKIFNMEKA